MISSRILSFFPSCFFLTLAGCGSCRGGNAPTPSGGTSVDVAVEEAGTATLRYGKATIANDGIEVWLTEKPATCTSPVIEGSTYVRFAVGAGPGGTFFVGHPFGVEVAAAIGKAVTSAAPFHSTITLDPFELRDGARLKGSVSFDGRGKPKAHGHGPFDVEICAKTSLVEAAAQPDAVSGDVQGAFGDKTFFAKSAIVELSEPADGPRYVDSVIFFADTNVTCGNRAEHGADALRVYDIGGVAQATSAWKEAQPAKASYAFLDEGEVSEHRFEGRWNAAWIRFDALDFERGTRAKGAMHADSIVLPGTMATAAKIEGAFEATVCPWANDDAPTSGSTVEITIDDAKVTATHARLRPLQNGVELVLSSEESECKSPDVQLTALGTSIVVGLATPTSKGEAKVLSSRVISPEKQPHDVTSETKVTFDAIDFREFAHARGTIEAHAAGLDVTGKFDATICPDRFGITHP